eukprot:TRINITY_DN1189_c0_g1_i1.p1 TRINITY_DN1189_c0_g1~~TRINITY_DN1189_c0_g1_i1.p1  ORF type:complete len:132 (+),score=31.44 TRINITY_DN1189_c0_g1_i1:81-476(+)
MKHHLVSSLLVFFLFFSVCLAGWAKPEGKKEELGCFTCKTVVKKLEAQFENQPRTEEAIRKAVKDICAVDTFRDVPEYSPPFTVGECRSLLSEKGYAEDLIELLLEGGKARKRFCFDVTKACGKKSSRLDL